MQTVHLSEFFLMRFQTHHQRMDGASLLNRHSNVHRQMAAFSELLRRIRDRYANDQLRQMLHAISVGISILPRRPVHSRLSTGGGGSQVPVTARDVTSLRQLHQMVDGLKREKRRRGIQKEDERHIVRYFETFFADVDYLATLKRYFEERIYACLYQYYYQPGVEDQITTSDCTGRPLATVSEDGGAREVWVIPEGTSVSDIVRQLWTLSRDWDMIIAGADLYVDDDIGYDVDPDAEPFENILQLIPRWVETGFKALQLAKIWWTEANKLYYRCATSDCTRDVSSAPAETKDLHRKIVLTEGELVAISDKIYQLEITIESVEEDLRQMRRDEWHLEALREKLNAAEEAEKTAQQNYEELLRYKELAERGDAGGSSVENIKGKLHVAFQQLEMTSYQVSLIRNDIDFEINMRADGDQQPLKVQQRSTQRIEEQLERLRNELAKDKDRKATCQRRLDKLRQSEQERRAISQPTALSDSQVNRKTMSIDRRHEAMKRYNDELVTNNDDDWKDAVMLRQIIRRSMVHLPSIGNGDFYRTQALRTYEKHTKHLPGLVKKPWHT